MKDKSCLVCKNIFTPTGTRDIACSIDCKRINKLQKRKAWRDNNKQSLLINKKQWRDNNKESCYNSRQNFYVKFKDKLKKYNKEYRINNKEKVRAHNLVQKDKKLRPYLYAHECMICGVKQNTIQHHPLYSFPYLVYPLCRFHHKVIHNEVSFL